MSSSRSIRVLGTMVVVAATVMAANRADAQLPTTVQLPSFSFFSYQGTVVVPDSGGAYLGGVHRSATGLNRRGLSRGFGSSLGNSQASLHATIIDQNEMDQQLLGGTPKEFMKSQRGQKGVDPGEEGKALVRYARQQYREGKQTESFDTYRMAINILPGGLRELATKEFERVFGASATQALRMNALRR